MVFGGWLKYLHTQGMVMISLVYYRFLSSSFLFLKLLSVIESFGKYLGNDMKNKSYDI